MLCTNLGGQTMKVFIDLFWFFKQEKKAYLIGIAMLLFVAMLQLIPPKIIGIIVDEISMSTLTSKKITFLLAALIMTAVLMYLFRFFWRKMIFGSAVKLANQLRRELFHHFTKMSQSFYQRKRVGDLMAHATNDLQAIQQTAGLGVLTFVDSLATGGFVIIAMATTISWKLTLICLIPLPIMAILTNLYGSMLHKRFHKAQQAFSSLNDKTQESVTGIKVIKTFGQEKEDVEDFRKLSQEVVEKNIAVSKVDALFDPTISLIIGISFFLSLAFGSKFVLNHELTIGELVSFTTYLGLLIWPMLAFGMLFNIIERGRASNDRVKTLLREKSEIIDDIDAICEIPSGDLTFTIDHFTYPEEQRPVLKDIRFTLNGGETLGIVGKTGAGKTTLLKLLTREFDAKGIEIAGQPLQKYKIEKLLEAIGYVPQEHFLFSATVKENIAFTNPDASIESIYQAAKLANIHDDILQFTDGYDTVVGERGVSLSGGQKQRISIVRALMMDPEILLLDDSLSAVDAKTEEMILTALRENRKGKTTIISAHRLSAIEHADLIIVLDEGKIVQNGTHEQLMKEEDGWYKEMYLHQQLEQLVEHGG